MTTFDFGSIFDKTLHDVLTETKVSEHHAIAAALNLPPGDRAVPSALALQDYLKAIGKRVEIAYPPRHVDDPPQPQLTTEYDAENKQTILRMTMDMPRIRLVDIPENER